jgi:hypothetical protein
MDIRLPPRVKVDLDILQRSNNYPGLERLIKLAKDKHPEITRQQVKTFLDSDVAKQLTKVQQKRPADGHIVAFVPNENWQMDVFDMSRYMYSNQYYRYILCCVDVFTRQAYAEPLKLKDSESLAAAFQKIIDTAGVKPRSILSDHEAGFLIDPFQKLLNKYNIALNVNALHNHHALGIIDNFARRLKVIVTTIFLKNQTTKWTDRLSEIIRVYNKSEHSAINDHKPREAEKHKDEILQLNLEKNLQNKTISDLHAGDKVRKFIITNAKIEKGTDPRYSDAVFTVVSTHGQTIKLDDGSTLRRDRLLKVPNDTVSSEPNVITKEKKIYKEYKNK